MKVDLLSLPPDEYVGHLTRQTDRVVLIMMAGAVEAAILRRLQDNMPNLNSDERSGIFGFEGPCGSFSNRIRIAQGIGIIDRKGRKRAELLKEMRNVAAHSHKPISFDTPEIREGVAALFDDDLRSEIISWPQAYVRNLYFRFITDFIRSLWNPSAFNPREIYEDRKARKEKKEASREKPHEG